MWPSSVRTARRCTFGPGSPAIGTDLGRTSRCSLRGPGLSRTARRSTGPDGALVGLTDVSSSGPGQESVRRPGVDDSLDRHATLDRPFAAVALPVQLAGGVRVGIDGELAAEL